MYRFIDSSFFFLLCLCHEFYIVFHLNCENFLYMKLWIFMKILICKCLTVCLFLESFVYMAFSNVQRFWVLSVQFTFSMLRKTYFPPIFLVNIHLLKYDACGCYRKHRLSTIFLLLTFLWRKAKVGLENKVYSRERKQIFRKNEEIS